MKFSKFVANRLLKKAIEAAQRTERVQPCRWQASTTTKAQNEGNEGAMTCKPRASKDHSLFINRQDLEKRNDPVNNILLVPPENQDEQTRKPWENKRIE